MSELLKSEDDLRICESCEEGFEDDEMCHHDHHTFCKDCCESTEPMDWNDLD
jgi:hypothetical protein